MSFCVTDVPTVLFSLCIMDSCMLSEFNKLRKDTIIEPGSLMLLYMVKCYK